MKIRFGVGLAGDVSHAGLADLVDRLETLGVDSLWFSELPYADAIDPVVGMSHALARTTRLKVGSSVAVLPGRHPVQVAAQLASLAALAPKRVLPVFGLQPASAAERAAFVVPEGRRAAVFDESLRLLRTALHDGGPFHGEFFSLESTAVAPRPVVPLDIWLGGSAPAGLRRIGRLADGWLGSFLRPDEARRGRELIEDAAADAGRRIDDDHYGINLAVSPGRHDDALLAAVAKRRPDVDPTELVAVDWPQLHRRIDAFVDAGLSKFVIRPAGGDVADFAERFARELLPRQN